MRSIIASSVRDDCEADDLTQEVFARALPRLAEFEAGETPFRAYLAQTARNLLRDRWRRQQRQPIVGLGSIDRATPGPDPAVEVTDAFDRVAVIDALRKLPVLQRAVLRLRILEGRSTKEVAVLLERNEDAVRQIQHRALLFLRQEYRLDAEGDWSAADRSPTRPAPERGGEVDHG